VAKRGGMVDIGRVQQTGRAQVSRLGSHLFSALRLEYLSSTNDRPGRRRETASGGEESNQRSVSSAILARWAGRVVFSHQAVQVSLLEVKEFLAPLEFRDRRRPAGPGHAALTHRLVDHDPSAAWEGAPKSRLPSAGPRELVAAAGAPVLYRGSGSEEIGPGAKSAGLWVRRGLHRRCGGPGWHRSSDS